MDLFLLCIRVIQRVFGLADAIVARLGPVAVRSRDCVAGRRADSCPDGEERGAWLTIGHILESSGVPPGRHEAVPPCFGPALEPLFQPGDFPDRLHLPSNGNKPRRWG